MESYNYALLTAVLEQQLDQLQTVRIREEIGSFDPYAIAVIASQCSNQVPTLIFRRGGFMEIGVA